MKGPQDKSLPLVTVIIPCHNSEKFIKQTIDSALSQTYGNIEVIAVNDGSTDATRQILDSYRERIRVLEHPGGQNKGQWASANFAMRHSGGDYVALLDHDDLWAPAKIERQVNFLDGRPDIGLVYINGHAIDENGNRLYKLFPLGHVEANRPEKILLNCYIPSPSNSLVRRAALDKAGEFDEELSCVADHDILIRLAEVTRFAFLDENLYFYRRHANQLSQRSERRMWENGFKVLDKACKRYGYSGNVRRKRLAVLNYRLGRCVADESGILRALPFFFKSGFTDPLRAIKILFGLESKN